MPIVKRAIPGYEGLYEVSSDGNVFSLDRTIPTVNGQIRHYRGRRISPSKSKAGYRMAVLHNAADRHLEKVATLVAIAFIGARPSGFRIDHINRIRDDDRLENLRWLSPSDSNRNKNLFKNNKSGIRHVCWSATRRRWLAVVNGLILGSFDTIAMADAKATAYKRTLPERMQALWQEP
jgi:hypothetical protein